MITKEEFYALELGDIIIDEKNRSRWKVISNRIPREGTSEKRVPGKQELIFTESDNVEDEEEGINIVVGWDDAEGIVNQYGRQWIDATRSQIIKTS
jgi:hypothetical protein